MGEKMDDVLVSFCIATFQRYEVLKELITEILSVDDFRFEIVVCDDCSKDAGIEKLREIQDQRLKIFVNDSNVGSLQNIYEALEHGRGKYLFYINDRDNVDSFKIKKLLSILDELSKKNVAFILCSEEQYANEKYLIYNAGEEAFLEFACKVVHATGYIFLKNVWSRLKYRKLLFEKQCYGNYPLTMICAMMSFKYNGALIFGDICDIGRKRIDFTKVKSGYYLKRKDKRVWYSAEVQWKELMIAYKFLKQISVEEALIDTLLYQRYKEDLKRITIQYQEIISEPSNTLHYNLQIPQKPTEIHGKAIRNALYLWRNMQCFCRHEHKAELLRKVNRSTRLNWYEHISLIYNDLLKI